MKRLIGFILFFFVLLGGCHVDTDKVSMQTDETVHGYLDAAWSEPAGPKPEVLVQAAYLEQRRAREIQDEVARHGILTLEQALQLAELTSPEYQLAKETLYLTALNQRDAAHLFDLIPFGGGTSGYGNRPPDEATSTQAQFGISQLLATGATIGADMTIGYVDVLTGDFRSGATSLLQAVTTVPLLRGADRKVVLETLTQAEHETLYAVRAFERLRQTLYVGVIEDYGRTAELAWQVRNARENLASLKEAHASMKSLTKVGRVIPYEVDQTYQEILTAGSELGELEKDYGEAIDLLKLRLHLPPQIECVPATELPMVQIWKAELNLEEAIAVTLNQRLDLANSRDRVADAERKVEVAADALKGDLLLSGAAMPVDRNNSRTDRQYDLWLQGNLPLDRTLESSEYKRALVALRTQERDDLQLRYLAVSEVRQAWRAMQEAEARYRVQDEARGLARKRLMETSLLLRYSRASVRDVLDAQEDLYDAENEYIDALTDFSLAQMAFLRDTGLLTIPRDGQGLPERISANYQPK